MGWYSSDYLYRRKITIDKDKFASTLTDFPVYVKLSATNFDFSKVESTGYDIRFTASDGTTLLKFDRESFNKASEYADFHVKVPSISNSADTDIYIYYGYPSATDGVDPENVYNSNFKVVLHLKESGDGTAGEYLDSTSNNHDGQGGEGNVTQVPTQATGITKFGENFDGSNDFISLPDSADWDWGTSNFTISFWAKLDSSPEGRAFFGRRETGTSYLYFGMDGGNLRFRDYKSGETIDCQAAWSPSNGTWYRMEIVRNGSTFQLFANKTQIGSDFTNSNSFNDRSTPLEIGGNTGIGYFIDGILDEFRFSNVDRGSAWRDADVDNFNNLINTYGDEESSGINESETITITESETFDITSDLTETLNISDVTVARIIERVSDILQFISYNPLLALLNTTPTKLVKIDITDPSDPLWTVYSYPEISNPKAVCVNSTNGYIYLAGDDGLIAKISIANYASYSILDVVENIQLTNIDTLDGAFITYASSDDSTGQLFILDERTLVSLATNFPYVAPTYVLLSTIFTFIQGLTITTNFPYVASTETQLATQFFWMPSGFISPSIYEPITRTDIKVYLDNVEVHANDVDLRSVRISHNYGEKSTANVTFARRHDALNIDAAGNTRTITNKNALKITIDGNIEFNGFISQVNATYAKSTETVMVTAYTTDEVSELKNFVTLSLPGLTENRNVFQVISCSPQIVNPYIDPLDTKSNYYNGVSINLGENKYQWVSRWQFLGNITTLAANIEADKWQPEVGWNYFWFVKCQNFALTSNWFDLFIQNERTTAFATLRYIGTSMQPITSDAWYLSGCSYMKQQGPKDYTIEAGTYTLGTAPFKEISAPLSGAYYTVPYYEDRPGGLYNIIDEGYNYKQFVKDWANVEFQNMKNINGDLYPITSAEVNLTFDAYYFYNLKILTRFNISNTTVTGIYENQNGFPIAIKGISIDCNNMTVSLSADNIKVESDLMEYPDTDQAKLEYKTAASEICAFTKLDMKSLSTVHVKNIEPTDLVNGTTLGFEP